MGAGEWCAQLARPALCGSDNSAPRGPGKQWSALRSGPCAATAPAIGSIAVGDTYAPYRPRPPGPGAGEKRIHHRPEDAFGFKPGFHRGLVRQRRQAFARDAEPQRPAAVLEHDRHVIQGRIAQRKLAQCPAFGYVQLVDLESTPGRAGPGGNRGGRSHTYPPGPPCG